MGGCAEFHVAVAAGGDVEVALYFVAFERAVDTASILWDAAGEARGFGELFGGIGAHVA